MRAARLLSSAAAVVLLTTPAAAQVTTHIVPDTGAFATGTTATAAGNVTTIAGGTLAGGNLFHSFATFDLGAGDTARWTAANPGGVTNVINRVTGGNFSTIAGVIDTTALPNAGFYFINPAGVLFTGGAQLNVPGAAYISTAADGVKFADGLKFSAVTPNGSTFSLAAPQGFGFLGIEAPIVIDGVANLLPKEGVVDLSLFGSDVGVRNSIFVARTFTATTTHGLGGLLSLADPFGTAPLVGATTLINAKIFTTATGKGVPAIRIATGALTQQGGVLSASTVFDGDAGDLRIAAQSADITGQVVSNTGEDVVHGDAGTVRLDVGVLHVGDLGELSSSTFGAGAGGNVIINAGSVTVDTQGSIGSDSAGKATGSGGSVQITANTLSVATGGSISSSTIGSGDGGTVAITAGAVTVDDGDISSATLGGTGRGGLITIQANQLTLRNQGGIGTSTSGAGDAGKIVIKGGAVTLSSEGLIFSTGLGPGAAGDISLDVASLTATDALITSDAEAGGRAGLVNIKASGAINLSDSTITSDTAVGAGLGGDVVLNAASVTLTNDSQISTDTFGDGAAGRVTIVTDKLALDFSAILSAAGEGSTGSAGTIQLQTGQITLANQSVVTSSTFGAGAAGQISVRTTGLTMTGGSGFESAAREGSSGDGGQIAVTATTVSMDNSIISSSTFATGRAGDVSVNASHLSLANASSIQSGVGEGASGHGGAVHVTATSDLSLATNSAIVTSTIGDGDAGQLSIVAGKTTVDSSLLASRANGQATGAAGSLTIQGDTLAVTNGGHVETSSVNPHTAGAIGISLTGGLEVSGAGSIISSANLSAFGGAAGSISIAAAPIRLLDGGTISTNAVTGAAGDITLRLPSNSIVLLDGRTDPGVITTSSGPGTGGKITITDPLAIISNGGRILALGQQRGANVHLTSDFFIRSADRVNELSVDGQLVVDSTVSDVSAGVVIPDIAFLDASGVLRGQCPAARSTGASSQLRLRPFGPYGGQPGDGGVHLSGGGAEGCGFAPSRFSPGLEGVSHAEAPTDFGRPRILKATYAETPLAAPSFAATITLADVAVEAPSGAGHATPHAGWQAGRDPATGLALEAPRAAGFDAAWVKRQFAANGLVGQPAPVDRLLALTQLINLAFVRNGYVNSGVLFAGPIPRDGGVLQMRLVYGHTPAGGGTRVRFGAHGRKGLSDRYVRARMPAAEAAPFNALDVEQQFRRLAQDPAVRTVGADLAPGAAPGEANLEVLIDPAPRFDAYVTVANSRSPSIGGERYAVGGSVRNVAVAGDALTAEVGVTGGRADESFGYDLPLWDPATSVSLRASHDDAAVVDSLLRPLGIRSTDWSVEGGLSRRVIDTPLTPLADGGGLQPARSLTFGLRFAHREQETWLLGQPFSFSPGTQDGRSRYDALRLTADYVQRGVTQVLAVSAVATQGLGGTHSPAAGSLDPSDNFHVLLVQASYARRLGDGWELRLRGAAQLADGPLYTGERFSLGGQDTVRGYRENLILSDSGAFASAELARAFSLDGGRRGWAGFDWGAFTASVFADGGIARNRNGPDPEPDSLGSLGVGLAWTPSDAVTAHVAYAKALRDAPAVGERDLQDRGFEFRVVVRPLALFGR